MNKLLHHLHSSIQLIQRQNVLLSKEPQPRALPKILSKKERLGEDGEYTMKLSFQKKPAQTRLNSHCYYADSFKRRACLHTELMFSPLIMTGFPISPFLYTHFKNKDLFNETTKNQKISPILTFVLDFSLNILILKHIFCLSLLLPLLTEHF